MTSRSKLVLASSVIAATLSAGCGGNSPASAGQGQVGYVRAAQAVVNRRPSPEVDRRNRRSQVVESLIVLADQAGRNDWRRFERAIADARRAIQRYRQSTGGDTAALEEVETFAETVDHVIALASYDGTEPDIDDELPADADTINAVVHLGVGVNIDALTGAVSGAIAAAAKTRLPVELPQR
jgi:hypothetical protein